MRSKIVPYLLKRKIIIYLFIRQYTNTVVFKVLSASGMIIHTRSTVRSFQSLKRSWNSLYSDFFSFPRRRKGSRKPYLRMNPPVASRGTTVVWVKLKTKRESCCIYRDAKPGNCFPEIPVVFLESIPVNSTAVHNFQVIFYVNRNYLQAVRNIRTHNEYYMNSYWVLLTSSTRIRASHWTV